MRALDLRWLVSSRRGRFVLFAQGRAGGTVLGDLLDHHPLVRCEGELLYRPVARPRVWCHAARARHRGVVYGFRVKIYQLTEFQRVRDAGAWLRSMHRLGWAVLYLRRENLLRHVVSNAVVHATGVHHRRVGEPAAPTRVHLDPRLALELIEMRARNLEAEARALHGVPHLALTYERDILDGSGRSAALDRAFEYLGVEPVPVTTTLARTGTTRLADQVENYDELAAAVRASPYARFLDG